MKIIIKPTFVVLFGIVATLHSCSGNSIEQNKETEQKLVAMNRSLDSAIQNLDKIKVQMAANDAQTKTLLIQYYKAGWMAASNGIIDLYNAGRFTDGNIAKIKFNDWRQIENLVNSR